MKGSRSSRRILLSNRLVRKGSLDREFYENLINTQPSGVYQIRFAMHAPFPSSKWMPALQGHYQVQFVSDRFCQILGLSREAFTADPSILPAHFHPEDRQRFLDERAQAVREVRRFHWEGRIANGSSLRWVRLESFPRVMEEGTTLWTGLITDITERKQADAILQEEQGVFLDLVTALPVGIYRLRVLPTPAITADEWECTHLASYKVDFVSDRFCAIAGLCRETFQADPGLILGQVHPEDRADFNARNAEALTGLLPFRWEGRLLGDGPFRWVRFESLPRLLPDGGSLWTGVLTDITERRTKGDEFRRTHRLLRQVEAIAKVGGWEIDLEAGTLYWSDEVFRIHELEAGSYTPTVESSIQFYAPEWRPVITRAVQRAIETGENFELDLELLTATGQRIWVHATSQVVLKDGRVIKVLGAFRDITQERLAAETIASSHAVLAGIMESAEGPIFSVDQAYCYTSFNKAHAAVMRTLYGRDISLGSSILDHQTVQADRDRAKANLDRALAGATFSEEAASGEVGRSRLYFEVAHTPIRTVEGEVCGAAVFARDITKRHVVEDALRESERRYRLISENSADVIWMMDVAQGRFTYVSPSVERLRGYTAEEVLAQPMEASLTPESHQRVVQSMTKKFPRYEAGDETYRVTAMQVDQPCRDGHIVPTEVVTTLLKDDLGKVSHVLGVSRDITERKESEQKNREQLEELQRWQAVMLNREDRVQQLKREVNDLAQRLGEGVRYASEAVDSTGAGSEEPKP